MIDFPAGTSQDVRIQVCQMLEEKDKELKQLYKDIIVLENKLERFNGSLSWSESEALKTQMAVNKGILEQVRAGLKSYNLRYIEYSDPKSPHAFPIKIIRIGIFERITTFLKSLIKFQIIRKV